MEQKKDAEEAWWIQGMNSEKARRAQCPAGYPTCFLFSSTPQKGKVRRLF